MRQGGGEEGSYFNQTPSKSPFDQAPGPRSSTGFFGGLEVTSRRQLRRQILDLGIQEGDLLSVKIGLRALGSIEGGPVGLLQLLHEIVGEDAGGLVLASFIRTQPIVLAERSPPIDPRTERSYAGAVANAVLRIEHAGIGGHPIQRFTALGETVKDFVTNHHADDYGYQVLLDLALADAKNVKLGDPERIVGLGTQHVAIGLLGMKQWRERRGLRYRCPDRGVALAERDWAGGCPIGFKDFEKRSYDGTEILSEGPIGDGRGKVTSMAMSLRQELLVLRENPSAILCDRPHCPDCRGMWSFNHRGWRQDAKRIRTCMSNFRRIASERYLPQFSWQGGYCRLSPDEVLSDLTGVT